MLHRRAILGGLAAALPASAGAAPLFGFLRDGLIPAVVLGREYAGDFSLESRADHYGVGQVAVALVRQGRPAGARGLKAGGDTVFQAASLSKVVTALAVMALARDGRVELGRPANAYLKGWRFAGPQGESPATVRELLSHTAGAAPAGYPGLKPGAPVPGLLEILNGDPPVTAAFPRGRYRYAGGGYMVLQKLIEDVSGQAFDRFVQGAVLAPLGMRRSSFRLAPPAPPAVARGYAGDPYPEGWRVYPQSAAAGLWTTANDLARLMASVARAWQGSTREPWPPALIRLMGQPVVDGMGLGFGVAGEGADLRLSHEGWNTGYRGALVIYPNRGEAIAVLASGDGGDLFAREVVRGAAAARGWGGFEPRHAIYVYWAEARLEDHAGRYQFAEAGFAITVRRQHDRLVIETPRGSRYTAWPVGPLEFVTAEDDERLVVTPDGGRLTLWGMEGVRVTP